MAKERKLKWWQQAIPAILTGGLSLPATNTIDIIGRVSDKIKANKDKKAQTAPDVLDDVFNDNYTDLEDTTNTSTGISNNILIVLAIIAIAVLLIVFLRKKYS